MNKSETNPIIIYRSYVPIKDITLSCLRITFEFSTWLRNMAICKLRSQQVYNTFLTEVV